MIHPREKTSRNIPLITRGLGVLRLGARAAAELFIVLYGLIMGVYLVARLTVGEQAHAVAFTNNFVPWWALGGLVCGSAALLMRHRWPLLALQLPILIAFGMLYGHQFWPHTLANEQSDGPELTVVTYNMESNNANVQAAARMLHDLDADVVGLQEINLEHSPDLANALRQTYPYQYIPESSEEYGLGLLSRYPIIDQAVDEREKGYARYLRTVLDVDGTATIVYVVHPTSPRAFHSPFKYDDSKRDEDLAEARKRLAAENGPLLMLCDCNMTDQSSAYDAMNRLLADTFREVGWGLGLTFPARANDYFPDLFPLLRLEYIWHNEFFTPFDAHVHPNTGSSDHHPVVARLVLKQGVSLG